MITLTAAQCRTILEIPVSVCSDEKLNLKFDGEVDAQAQACRITPDTPQPALDEGLLRRVARALAADGVPLGLLGDGEYGAARIPVSDAELERIEGPYRKFVFG